MQRVHARIAREAERGIEPLRTEPLGTVHDPQHDRASPDTTGRHGGELRRKHAQQACAATGARVKPRRVPVQAQRVGPVSALRVQPGLR